MSNNDPAFPYDERDPNGQVRQNFGLTKLEIFTLHAMQGLLAYSRSTDALAAIRIACGTLAALEKAKQMEAVPKPASDSQGLELVLREVIRMLDKEKDDGGHSTAFARAALSKWEAQRERSN